LKIKPLQITWKDEEGYLRDFTYEHSSPGGYVKDLIKEDYKKKKKSDSEKVKDN
jgi:hypothetical protein